MVKTNSEQKKYSCKFSQKMLCLEGTDWDNYLCRGDL